MKINKKALELIENGLSSKTVSKLTESQINILHKKLVNEQINVSKTDTATISKLKSEKKPFQVYEKELDEEEEVTVDPNKEVETQDPKQVGPSSDDGFGNEDDGMGMFESEADLKPGQPNPWAICHAQVGPKKTRKFERCVQSVKKQLAEGKNPLSLFLENQITKLVEKHVPPKITKGELLKYLSEGNKDDKPSKKNTEDAPYWEEIDVMPRTPKIEPKIKHPFKNPYPKSDNGTKTAPVRTKPDVKPATRPAHPMKNPHPGEKINPKAKTTVDEAQPEKAPTIAPTRTKPDVRPKPAHPMKNPHPGEKTNPKAKKISPEVAKDKVIDTIMNILKK